MPIITFDGPKLTKEQKAELAKVFTKSAAETSGLPERASIVMFKESSRENVAVGGVLLSDRE
jgi:4-oxalocrotonate tautomerase